MNIDDYLKEISKTDSPDLHLKVGKVPVVRLANGELYDMQNSESVTVQIMDGVVKQVLSEKKLVEFQKKEEVDTAYSVMGVGRFRVNVYMESDGPAIAFRSIPQEVPSLESMGMPEILKHFTNQFKGLVVVTGPTGHGKSTTLAAMVNEINHSRRSHIITIEDPIEFVHQPKLALITQREVGTHTRSFPKAIRSALRQDPDVILVGEMRDLETIAAAITLAETGHLVLATLHTQDAAQTVDRMIDVFPPHQQQQIRTQLASSLLGVVAQRLVPKADGKGRALAIEVLVRNDAIANCIREAKTNQINSMMQIGRDDGMITLDSSLAELYNQGKITEEAMHARANDNSLIDNLSE